MRLSSLFGPDFRTMLREEPEALREAVEELHEEDMAEIATELSVDDAVLLIRVLPEEFAAGVLERIPDELRTQIFEHLKVEETATLIAEMATDEAADAVQELEGPLAQKVLAELDKVEPEAAEEIRELVAYDDGTVGSIMTKDFVGLMPDTKIWKVLDEVRRLSKEGAVETINYVYGTAFGDKLVGVASLRDLILADPSQELADVMSENVVRVLDTNDRAEAARVAAKYDFSAIPVVNAQGQMVGLVTIDDLIDVVIEEATEDAQKMGAVSPIEDGYFRTGFFEYWKSRVTWLVVLFLGGFLTATVMQRFEADLSRVIALAVFIPLIISTGGNAGSQSATLIIRALSLDEVKPSDWARVLVRELLVGLALGVVVGALGFVRAYFTGETEPILLAIVVSISILSVVTVGSLVGSLLPLLIQRLGLDPAVSSTPFIASLSDVIGLLVYLEIARRVLGLE